MLVKVEESVLLAPLSFSLTDQQVEEHQEHDDALENLMDLAQGNLPNLRSIWLDRSPTTREETSEYLLVPSPYIGRF